MDKSKIIDTQTFLIDNESNKIFLRSQTISPNVSNGLHLTLSSNRKVNII